MLENVTKDLREQMINVCKVGQVQDCCRYLMVSADGFECARFHKEAVEQIDRNVANGDSVAQAINCKGLDLISLETKGEVEQQGKNVIIQT